MGVLGAVGLSHSVGMRKVPVCNAVQVLTRRR